MSEMSIEDIKSEREKAIDFIKQHITEDFEVIDNIQEDKNYTHPLEYLGDDLKAIANADMVFMWGDYLSHNGCRIEKFAAEIYGIKVEYADSYKFKRFK